MELQDKIKLIEILHRVVQSNLVSLSICELAEKKLFEILDTL